MLHDLAGIGCGRGHDEMLLAEPRRGAVVHGEAILAQHQPVARAADLQRREFVDIDAIEKTRRIRPLNIDLAECRHIADSDRTAHRGRFTRYALLPARLVRPLIPLRPEPRPSLGEDGAVLDRPTMRRRQPLRPEVLTAMMACERAPGDRRIGRTKPGKTELGDRAPGQLRQNPKRHDIGGLALVRAHAERRVTLDVLAGAEALLPRQLDVLGGHIVLQIDKGERLGSADAPERVAGASRLLVRNRKFDRDSIESELLRSFRTELRSIAERL